MLRPSDFAGESGREFDLDHKPKSSDEGNFDEHSTLDASEMSDLLSHPPSAPLRNLKRRRANSVADFDDIPLITHARLRTSSEDSIELIMRDIHESCKADPVISKPPDAAVESPKDIAQATTAQVTAQEIESETTSSEGVSVGEVFVGEVSVGEVFVGSATLAAIIEVLNVPREHLEAARTELHRKREWSASEYERHLHVLENVRFLNGFWDEKEPILSNEASSLRRWNVGHPGSERTDHGMVKEPFDAMRPLH